jgi:CRISPR-associated protein Csx3
MNLLPAILFGGSPHTGKSTLFYHLTQALHERSIPHCGLRVCPDGDWSDEDEREQVRLLHITGKWSPDLVRRLCLDLQRRSLPLLADFSGHLTVQEPCVFRNCTHSLLLLRPEQEESVQRWQHLARANGLLPLAELTSQSHGTSHLDDGGPVMRGTFVGSSVACRPDDDLFEALVERVALLFSSYSPAELERVKLDLAPADLVVSLDLLLKRLAPQAQRWEPAMLPLLLAELPAQTPLAVYGPGPAWIYAGLAAHTGRQPLYQFDPRTGWIAPPPLLISAHSVPEMQGELHFSKQTTVLFVRSIHPLDYQQAYYLPFPPVPVERGLILDGRLPLWLTTALVRLYQEASVAWIACSQVQQGGAVVVSSRVSSPAPGEVVAPPTL